MVTPPPLTFPLPTKHTLTTAHCHPRGPHLHHFTIQGPCLERAAPVCQNQCCQAQSAKSLSPLDGPMGLLPSDAYRILVDQDRQLNLLQAQVRLSTVSFVVDTVPVLQL